MDRLLRDDLGRLVFLYTFLFPHIYSKVNSLVLLLTLLYFGETEESRRIPIPLVLISEVKEIFFRLDSSSR